MQIRPDDVKCSVAVIGTRLGIMIKEASAPADLLRCDLGRSVILVYDFLRYVHDERYHVNILEGSWLGDPCIHLSLHSKIFDDPFCGAAGAMVVEGVILKKVLHDPMVFTPTDPRELLVSIFNEILRQEGEALQRSPLQALNCHLPPHG